MKVFLYGKDTSKIAGLIGGLEQQQHRVFTIPTATTDPVGASRFAQHYYPDSALIVFPGVIEPRQCAQAFQIIGHYFDGLTLLCREATGFLSPRLVRVEGCSQEMYWFEAAAEELVDADWLGSALRHAESNRFVREQGPFNIPSPKRQIVRRAPHKKKKKAVLVTPLKTEKRKRRSNRCLSIPVGHITLELLPEQLPILAWFIAHVGREVTAAEIAEELEERNAVRRSPSTVNTSIIRLKNKLRIATGVDLIRINTSQARFSFIDHNGWAARLRTALEEIETCQPIFEWEKQPAREKPEPSASRDL